MADLTPLELSDDDLAALAEVTEQDIIAAQQFVSRAVDKKYQNLLLAQPEDLAQDANAPRL